MDPVTDLAFRIDRVTDLDFQIWLKIKKIPLVRLMPLMTESKESEVMNHGIPFQ